MFPPFWQHQLCTITVGCTSQPLHWSLLVLGIVCVADLTDYTPVQKTKNIKYTQCKHGQCTRSTVEPTVNVIAETLINCSVSMEKL
jgi:hypothetical protein